MKKRFQVENVKCSGCANTLMTKLKDEFGEIEVNLDVMPREITLDIEEDKIEALRIALRKLGYPMSDDNLGLIDNSAAKAKSFVSCAIGKFELSKES